MEHVEDTAKRKNTDIDISYLEIERLAEDLFPKEELGALCRNPVTDEGFVWWVDPTAVQIANAVRALRAREWFYRRGPRDAPQLPLSCDEIDAMRFKPHDPLCHIVAHYARSLRSRNWDYENHPSFEDYARGVLASEYAPDFVKADKDLCQKYPPRRLRGLGPGLSLNWDPKTKRYGMVH